MRFLKTADLLEKISFTFLFKLILLSKILDS